MQDNQKPENCLEHYLEKAGEIASFYLTGKDVDTIQTELTQAIEEQRLPIVFYGCYNSGKSTIINALLGKERAKISDCPTTDRVEAYRWQQFVLLDTPGVNAPIQHQQITEEQMAKAGLVVFVLRTSDQDSLDICQRIIHEVRRNKPLLIVLSHDGSCSAEELLQIQAAFNSNLQKVAGSEDMDPAFIEQLNIIPMRARSAMNARIANKQRLLDDTGYPLFESSLEQWARDYSSGNKLRAQLIEDINRRIIQPALLCINEKQDQVINIQQRQLDTVADSITDSSRALCHEMHIQVKNSVIARKTQVLDVIRQGNSDPAVLSSQLLDIAMPILHEQAEWLAQHIQAQNDALNMQLEELALHLHANFSDGNGIPYDAIRAAIRRIKGINPKPVIDALMKNLGRELPKNMGRALGAVFIVVIQLLDLFLASKQEQQANKQLHEQSIQQHQALHQILMVIEQSIVDELDRLISETSEAKLQAIREEQENLASQGNEMARHRQALTGCHRQLQQLLTVG